MLFDRICRGNGIVHLLPPPRTPTTTGKIELFHGSLRRELLDDAVPFAGMAAAQAAAEEYNTTRPHQGPRPPKGADHGASLLAAAGPGSC